MKKNLLFAFIMFCAFHSVNGQDIEKKLIPYYDAFWLKKYIKNNTISAENYTSPPEDELKQKRALLPSGDRARKQIDSLLRLLDKKETDSIFSFLKSYHIINSVITDGTKLNDTVHQNPFLTSFNFDAHYQSDDLANVNIDFGKLTRSVGGFDVTNIANGIADLMIDRAKQELTIAFFNRFKKFATDNPEFGVLFPKTTDNLNNLLSYSYPQMLPVLRNGFFDDLKQVTYHLEAVLELPKYKKLLENFPEIRVAIKSLKLVHDLEDKTSNAADVIKSFATIADWKAPKGSTAFKNMGGMLNLAKIISESLRESRQNNPDSLIWISGKEVKALVTDNVATTIYMGLLYQQIAIDDIRYYRSASVSDAVKDIFAKQKDNIELFQNKILEFISLTAKMNNALATLKTKTTLTDDDRYAYINTSLDVIDYAFSIVKLLDDKVAFDKYLLIARKANSLYKDIYSKRYTQAIGDALDIFGQINALTGSSEVEKKIFEKTVNDNIKKLQTADADVKSNLELLVKGKTLTNEQKQSIIQAIAAKKISPDAENLIEYYNSQLKVAVVLADDKTADIVAFADKVKPYALFIGNVVDAKSSDDVKAALENVILPVGSSSIKKNTTNNLSIQTYLGAYYSFKNFQPDAARAWSDKVGIYGPIGLSYTPGITSWGKGGSLSLFASAFDLGAIIDYKLKNDPSVKSSTDPAKQSSDTKQYSVNLGQLFSPGVHIVYGFFCNLPLSIGVGAQYGPGLSKIDAAGTTNVVNPTWRFNAFLAVDLPFFNLINKAKSTN